MRLNRYYLVALIILISCCTINAQSLSIKLLNINQEYLRSDALDIIINNNDNVSYYVTVGLEKYTDYDLWEEITSNILLSKSDIEGVAKGGLSFYLAPLGRVKVNKIISEINIPKLIIPEETKCDPTKEYRLSTSRTTDNKKIMSGKFRFSIKITNNKNENSFFVIKSNTFIIKD